MYSRGCIPLCDTHRLFWKDGRRNYQNLGVAPAKIRALYLPGNSKSRTYSSQQDAPVKQEDSSAMERLVGRLNVCLEKYPMESFWTFVIAFFQDVPGAFCCWVDLQDPRCLKKLTLIKSTRFMSFIRSPWNKIQCRVCFGFCYFEANKTDTASTEHCGNVRLSLQAIERTDCGFIKAAATLARVFPSLTKINIMALSGLVTEKSSPSPEKVGNENQTWAMKLWEKGSELINVYGAAYYFGSRAMGVTIIFSLYQIDATLGKGLYLINPLGTWAAAVTFAAFLAPLNLAILPVLVPKIAAKWASFRR
eukprot:jgi/Bigna1/73006/fgenesh1_pg.22_\